MTEKNAARHLYELLKQWRVTPINTSILAHRAGPGGDWWTPHVNAVRWFEEVREQLDRYPEDEADDDLVFGGAQMERIRRFIFLTDEVWSGGATIEREHLSIDDLGTLQLIARGWAADAVRDGTASSLLRFARDAEDLIHADKALDNASRDYLVTLISNLNSAIASVKIHGSVDVGRGK